MKKKKLVISNKLGLHARAACRLIDIACKHNANIEIVFKDKRVNAKSIIGLMTLAAPQWTEVEVITEGDDEQELISSVEQLFVNKFNESE